MSKVKTAQLSGAALDWAVADAEGMIDKSIPIFPANTEYTFHPSTNWAQGGPIIERERIRVIPWDRPVGVRMHGEWYAGIYDSFGMNGPTPLVAAMRCFVVSKLGEEVEVPDELVTP